MLAAYGPMGTARGPRCLGSVSWIKSGKRDADGISMPQDAFTGPLRVGTGSPIHVAAAQPAAPVLLDASTSPDLAVRARLNAVILDLVMLGVVTRVLLGAMGVSARSPGTELGLFLGLQFAYFYLFEASGGQTLGKRVFHVRVVSLDGEPIRPKQIALRNALRVADSLPVFYASGLISLMRTGRNRRQRIGDVAAGTTVTLDADGRLLRTPRWLLPVLTILATLVSLAVVIPAL